MGTKRMASSLLLASLMALMPTNLLTVSAAGPAATAGDHFNPPIRYTQVARPVSQGKPGKGATSTAVVYTPANIQAAYDFGAYAAGGAGKAIAIVDAYGDPNLASDLAAFTSQFGLPAASVNSSYPDGTPTSSNTNWGLETALDVEWAHANAQGATIDLVVVPDSSFQHLLDGINYAASLPNVAAISMSWGAPETSTANYGFLPGYEVAFKNAASKGIALLASSGDNGAYNGTRPKTLSVNYPASSPEVIGVGGTSLTVQTGTADYANETAWSGSGGGYSLEFTEPSYQAAANISDSKAARGIPDVAFDADPNTGVYVVANGSWYSVGGTSVGAPNWAAIAADNAAYGRAPFNPGTFYGIFTSSLYTADMHDITSGNNGYYNAGAGWDAVTGLGSADVAKLVYNP